MKPFSIIVAATANGFGIGRKGDLPWKIAEDMAFFKRVTTTTVPTKSNAVIMGRKTYESIPEKFRPLSDRINVVLSKDAEVRQKLGLPDSVLVARSLAEALEMLAGIADRVHDIFVIGGGTVYQEAIMSSSCAKIYLTEIVNDFPDIDTFFPSIPANKFRMTSRSKLQPNKDITFRFTEYVNIGADDEFSLAALPTPAPLHQPTVVGNAEEQQYLDIIRDIIDHGVLRGDRTGTGTISKFGVQMRFSLRNNVFPLLTTKRVFWRGVAEELVWFVRGCTNGNLLAEKDIHIWDGNGSREFLDSRGLHHREVGDLGPVYGFQVKCSRCHLLQDPCLRLSSVPVRPYPSAASGGMNDSVAKSTVHTHVTRLTLTVYCLCNCSGDISARPTRTCTRITPARASTSCATASRRSRTARRTGASCSPRGTPRTWTRWRSRRATCSASSTWPTASSVAR
jgi:dihydrofolate reductase/thymidylate synthase